MEVLNEILEIEPYDEKMALKLMDIYQKSGKRALAINYYNEFSYNLSCSLGIHPSIELRNKYNEVKMSVSDCNELKKTKESELKSKDKHFDIKINSYCMKNVDYFWMSDVIGKIVNLDIKNCIKQLNQKQLIDLGYIQSDILKYCNEDTVVDYKSELVEVCIINSFVKLLEAICNERKLTITIINKSDMDEISEKVVEYLKAIQVERLKFVEK